MKTPEQNNFDRPPIGALVNVTGYTESLKVEAHTERGFKYSGAIPLSIPRMGIHGDGTGEIFLDTGLVKWTLATTPTPGGTPTPRTERAMYYTKIPVPTVDGDIHEFTHANFARTLERELIAAKSVSPSPTLHEAAAGAARELFPELCTGLSDDTADFMGKLAIIERWVGPVVGRLAQDYLNEKACCSGADCGCRGVTRLQQMVYEEAGIALSEAQTDLQRVTEQRDEALRAAAIGAKVVEQNTALAVETHALRATTTRLEAELGEANLAAKNMANDFFPATSAMHELLRQAGCLSVNAKDYEKLKADSTRLLAENEALRASIKTITELANDAPELNMKNYSENDVSILNDFMAAIHNQCNAARTEGGKK